MPHVVICIPTFRRPLMLKEAIETALRQVVAQDVRVRILVADNDPDQHEGERLARHFASTSAVPVEALIVAERGISAARNALVSAALADPAVTHLAFMDDDQEASPVWLAEMLAAAQAHDAEIVASAVEPKFITPPRPWMLSSRVYQDFLKGDGPVERAHSTGGVLIAAALLRSLPPPVFDPDFSLTGGGDSDLFIRLARGGARSARAGRALIYEVYGPTRLTLKWALQRAFRVGSSDIRLRKKNGGLVAADGVRTVLGIAVGLAQLLWPLASSGQRVDALCRIWRGFGKATAILGQSYFEYQTTHGR